MSVQAVLLDVDFTILYPVRVFDGPGYAALGARFGLALDESRYDAARLAAFATVLAERQGSSLSHDETEHGRIAELIVQGMGGAAAASRKAAQAAADAWNDPANFALYDDVRPVLDLLRDAGVTVGFVSNTHRDLEAFLRPLRLRAGFALSSRVHGRVKPSPTIFAAALQRAGAPPERAVMVGDSLADDVQGASAAGLRGILLDRDGRHADAPVERIVSLRELPERIALS